MNKDYYPHNEASLTQWNQNFVAQLATTGLSLGFTQAEIDSITSTCSEMATSIANVVNLKAQLKEKTEDKNTVLTAGQNTTRAFVNRIKTSPTYTDAIGKLLGIVADGSSFDPNVAVPVIKLAKTGTGYDFIFSLQGYFNAVAIFRRMPGESNFSQIGIDMKSPYSIAPPTVSGVEFYFQYLKNDTLAGLKSDIIVVEL